MFPDGAAGLALIILRVCAGGSLLMCASAHAQLAWPAWTAIGLGLILVLIGVGALTPLACAGCALAEGFYILHGHGTDQLSALLALLIASALALLGPGAFSVDAKLFGRRLIVPRSS
jgi:Na+-translocating ferredoxin:NAD+ oxidoreductase RnfE subunit